MIPKDRQYTKEHEWFMSTADNNYRIGITDYAQEQLTDIVFVELPDVGKEVKAGEPLVVLESVKSVADVYAPCDCTITKVNTALSDEPSLVNDSPYDNGWLVEVHPSSSMEGMSNDEYQSLIED